MRKVCNVLKTGVAVLFAFAIIASGICFIGTDANEVYAATTSVKESTGYNKEEGYFVKKYDISSYKTQKTYPILNGAEYADAQDWLFAGWYTTDTCEASIGTTQDGEAWAKFVHIDVLSVKCQIEKGTDAGTNKTNMRLISTLDSLKYKTVGFKVRYDGGDELNFEVSKVFKRINASETNGNECGYSPAAFHDTSEYFMTYSLLNIANKNFSKPFYIEPYWITLDGTEVSGASRFARVEDRYLEIVNVPVRLHADTIVTGGSVTVDYSMEDEELYELYAIDEVVQYDNGIVFNAATVSNDATNKVATVTATEETEGVQANGMLVNLRFQMIADTMPSTSTFEIASSDFNVSDFIFKNFPLTYSGGYDISWYTGYEDSDTFAIASAADLYGLAALSNGTAEGVDKAVNFANKTIYLASDITINEGNPLGSDKTEGTTDDWATTAPSYVWAPIGKTTSFAGVFDGQGNTISGIYVNETTDNAGLFGSATDNLSTIQNIRIINSYICSSAKNVGSVIGYAQRTKLTNIYSDAYVESDGMYVGGLVGYVQNASSTKNISSCWFNGDVTGSSYCGGIVGCYNYGKTASIIDSLVTGTVHTTANEKNAKTGGIVGGTVNPTAYGNIKLTISSCVSVGAITEGYTSGDGHIGGVIGYRQANADLIIENVYTTQELGIGTESGTNKEGVVANCGVDSSILNGHIAYDTIDGFSFLSNTNTEGKWVVRKTAETLKDGVPIPEVFADSWIDVEWYYDNPSEDATHYSIATPKELLGFADIYNTGNVFNGKTINLADDIPLNPENVVTDYINGTSTQEPENTWTPGGNNTVDTQFAGTFDGHGHTISGIYTVSDSSYIGLFGVIANGSVVTDLIITDSYFYTSKTGDAMIGSVAGECRGTIDSVYSEAIVESAGDRVGGLVGMASGPKVDGVYGTATINNSWFNGTIKLADDANYCGGMIGLTMQGNVNVTNCLVTGTINNATAKTDGGLIGYVGYAGARNMVVNISDNLVALKEAVASTDVGNVIGTIKNNEAAVTRSYTIINTYVTEESFGGDSIIANNGEDDEAAVDGTALIKAEADVQGTNGYENTLLDFYVNEYDAGEWVARSGKVPALKTFVDEETESLEGKSQTGWYDDNINSYYLGTVSAFKAFRDYVNGGTSFEGKTVYLTDNMNLNPGWTAPTDTSETVTEPENSWTPIGNSANVYFQGTLNGQGNTISGVYVDEDVETEYTGLFGYTKDCIINGLRLENSYFSTTAANAGSIVAYGNGTLTNIYSNATIKSTAAEVGGLVGYAKKGTTGMSLASCWFAGNIDITYAGSGNLQSGGLVGYAYNCAVTINNCLYTGNLLFEYTSITKNPNARIGGLCGADNYNADKGIGYSSFVITNSISAGTIEGTLVPDITSPALNGVSTVFGHARGEASSCDNVYTMTVITKHFKASNATNTVNNTLGAAIYASNAAKDTTFDIDVSYAKEDFYGLGAYTLTNLDFETPIWAAREGKVPAPAVFVPDDEKLPIPVEPDTDITDQGEGTEENP